MRILRQADQWARTAAWDESKERGWIRIPGGGWEHESGDARILPSQDIPGHWQLWDQTVRGPDHWAPIKQPSINPQHLMNFADWASGRVERPNKRWWQADHRIASRYPEMPGGWRNGPPPRVMYHLTRSTNRPSITEHGLLVDHSDDSDEFLPRGIYMTPTMPTPYAGGTSGESWDVPDDIWEIDADQLEHLEEDDPGQFQEFGGSYWTKNNVPPSAMKLIHQGSRDDDEDDDWEDFADETAWFAAGWDDEDDEIEHLAL